MAETDVQSGERFLDASDEVPDYSEICDVFEDVEAMGDEFGAQIEVPDRAISSARTFMGVTYPEMGARTALIGYENGLWIEITELSDDAFAQRWLDDDTASLRGHAVALDVNGNRGIGHNPIDVAPEFDSDGKVISGTGVHSLTCNVEFAVGSRVVTVTHPDMTYDMLLGVARQVTVEDISG